MEYAGILAQLAATAHRFLMRLQMHAAPTQQQVQTSQHLTLIIIVADSAESAVFT